MPVCMVWLVVINDNISYEKSYKHCNSIKAYIYSNATSFKYTFNKFNFPFIHFSHNNFSHNSYFVLDSFDGFDGSSWRILLHGVLDLLRVLLLGGV